MFLYDRLGKLGLSRLKVHINEPIQFNTNYQFKTKTKYICLKVWQVGKYQSAIKPTNTKSSNIHNCIVYYT